MSYQSVWRDGREVRPGQRDCAGRYKAISQHLRGRAGFRVLDLGAYSGYFAARLAEEFSADVVAIDDYHGLPAGVKGAPVHVINKRVTAAEVRELGRFDVILALSFLHHVPDWREMLSVILESGKTIFIETPVVREALPKAISHCRELAEEVEALGGRVIARTPGYMNANKRPLYVLER